MRLHADGVFERETRSPPCMMYSVSCVSVGGGLVFFSPWFPLVGFILQRSRFCYCRNGGLIVLWANVYCFFFLINAAHLFSWKKNTVKICSKTNQFGVPIAHKMRAGRGRGRRPSNQLNQHARLGRSFAKDGRDLLSLFSPHPPFSHISLVINIYFPVCRTNSVRGLIMCMVNYGRVGKYIMRKSKRYPLLMRGEKADRLRVARERSTRRIARSSLPSLFLPIRQQKCARMFDTLRLTFK
jgi:hypothetical protein